MKNIIRILVLLVLFASTQVFAQSSKPTPESVSKLIELTNLKGMLPEIQGQLDGMMNSMMQEMLKGKSISQDQQKALDVFRSKVVKIQKDEINWDNLEPKLTTIYENTLTQEDVDGIIAFYQSPAGQAYLKKMPEITQQTMTMMQASMVPVLKKIEAAGVELRLDLQRVDQK